MPAVGRIMGDLEKLETAGRDLETAIDATRERITFGAAKTRMRQRRRLRSIEQLAGRAGVMVTSARSTGRAVSTMARHRQPPDPALVSALEQLAQALLEMRSWVRGQARMVVVQEQALRAAVTASALPPAGTPTAEHALAWQIRGSAVDILRVLGLSTPDAVAALEEAAGRADQTPPTDTAPADTAASDTPPADTPPPDTSPSA